MPKPTLAPIPALLQVATPLPPELAGPKGLSHGVPASVAPGVHPAGDEVRAVLGDRLPDPADFPAAHTAAAAEVRAICGLNLCIRLHRLQLHAVPPCMLTAACCSALRS